MKRILTYPIHTDAAGWSILRFLKEKNFSRTVIVQLKKTENGILVNGEWAYVNHILKEGDILTLQLLEPGEPYAKPQQAPMPRHAMPGPYGSLAKPQQAPMFGADANCGRMPYGSLAKPQQALLESLIEILYEDEDLLVANKPAGMPIHPSMGHTDNTLANAIHSHAMQRHESYPYRCVNRLDRDTSGLTVIAKNAYSSCILYGQMRERQIHRTYYAIAEGMTQKEGTINAPIARKEGSVIERMVDATGEPAVTHFQTLACQGGLSFLKLWLETGRTHQIRVHMRHIGHPLIGDFLYNPKDSRMERQALHAGNLSFTHPVTGQPLQFCAPLPDDMARFFQIAIS